MVVMVAGWGKGVGAEGAQGEDRVERGQRREQNTTGVSQLGQLLSVTPVNHQMRAYGAWGLGKLRNRLQQNKGRRNCIHKSIAGCRRREVEQWRGDWDREER